MATKQFSIIEAMSHLNYAVVPKKIPTEDWNASELGIIVGILTLNDEVEVVVKFLDGLKQFNKSEFNRSLKVLKE